MALYLPCNNCIDKRCKRSRKPTYACKEISKALGTGKAWAKKRTYSVNLDSITESSNPLNDLQLEVLGAIQKISENAENKEITKLIIEKAMMENLSEVERYVIDQLFLKDCKQIEIAQGLGISQPRVNFIKVRALKKLKAGLPDLMYKFIPKKSKEDAACEKNHTEGL